jgi:hypothetical protein
MQEYAMYLGVWDVCKLCSCEGEVGAVFNAVLLVSGWS